MKRLSSTLLATFILAGSISAAAQAETIADRKSENWEHASQFKVLELSRLIPEFSKLKTRPSDRDTNHLIASTKLSRGGAIYESSEYKIENKFLPNRNSVNDYSSEFTIYRF